jgi:hypothetical protein
MSARLYTAHLAPGQVADETLLIHDGWRWGAFLFPLLWALWNRHWVLAPILLVAGIGFGALASFGQPALALVLELGLRLWLGLEGGEMARLDRRLRGWRERGAVSAQTEDEAALTWFRVSQS